MASEIIIDAEFIENNEIDVVDVTNSKNGLVYLCVINQVLKSIKEGGRIDELSRRYRKSKYRDLILDAYEEAGKTIPGFIPYRNKFYIIARVFKEKEGSTIEEALQYIRDNIKKLQTVKSASNERLYPDRIFVGYDKPDFERFTGNDNKKTFDRVSIILKTTLDTKEEHMRWLQKEENKRFMYDYALQKISESKAYQKYGIPVTYLRLDQIGVSKTFMRLIFTLKE